MRHEIASEPEFAAMFLDEARLASRIEHPNVVATLDVVSEAGELFIVMEYVRGESLHHLMRASRQAHERIPVQLALSIICGVLSGLHAAHEATGEDGSPLGIVHRDVSPQNILVGEDGIPRIIDFGIAKAESRLQTTREGQVKGKLSYMAPEQMSSDHSPDRRVDIFTTATVLWELLAGKRLFQGDHPGETMARVLAAPIPLLQTIREDIPESLDEVIQRALSREPEARPQTAEEFALGLENALGGSLASTRAVGAWVSKLVGGALEDRQKIVRDIESFSSSSLPSYADQLDKPEETRPEIPTSRASAIELNAFEPEPEFARTSLPAPLENRWTEPPIDPRIHNIKVVRKPLPWFLVIFAFGLLGAVITLLVLENKASKVSIELEASGSSPLFAVSAEEREAGAPAVSARASSTSTGRAGPGARGSTKQQQSKKLPEKL
jgi:serine/threonine-protein kinase